MAAKGRKQKIFRIAGGLFVLLLLIGLALPVWFPWLARPLAKRIGITYAAYDRQGYNAFVLRNVTFSIENVRVHANRVQGLIPSVLLRSHYFHHQSSLGFRAEDWAVEILPSDKKASSPPASVYKIEHQVGAILSAIHQWLPKADFTNGLIQVRSAAPSGAARQEKTNFELRVSQAIWTNGTLWAKTEWLRTSNSVWTGKVQARVDTSPYDIVIVSEPLHLATNIRVYDQGGTLHVESTNLWWTNLVVASAQFGPEGAVPSVANIRADSFKIAAEALGLNDFEDLAGSGSFAWQQEHFALDLTTAAHPKFSTQWLAIDVQVHSTGNIHSAFIEKARISSPWLLAELTPGTELNFSSPFLQQDAILKVSLNLNRQPWFASEGQLNGQVVLRPSQEKFPALSFDFSGAGIGLTNIQTKTLAVKGEFRWPMLSLSGLEIVFPDNSRGSLLGELDVATGKIRQGRLQVDGMLGRKFLPADYSFDRAGLDMTFSGALGDLSHSGQLTIQNLFSPELRPLQVQANWAGQGKGVSHSDVVVLAGKSSLRAAFALATTNHQINFLLQTLTLEHDSQPVMALEAPAEVLLREDRSTTRATIWTAKIQPLKWHGHNRQLDLEGELAWPLRGHVSGSARSLDFSLFEDFSKHRPGEIKVETLKFTSDWDEGPANISLDAAIFMITKGVSFSAQASLKGNSQGISLEGISIFTEAQPVFSAHGFLPLTLTPSQSTHRLNLLSDRPLQIDLLTKTNSLFWDEIAVSTGLVLVEPDMNMNLSGTWQLPKGHLDMKVKQIKLPAGLLTSVSTLMLEKLQLAVDLEQKQARIRDLNLLVEGQPLSLTADMPLGKSFWESLAAGKPNLDWENIRAELKTEHAQLAAFTRLLPKVLAPQGTMDLNVRLERGARVNGELTISGAATRSLGNFGAIRDIDVSMAFHESTLELKSVTAHLGGSPLSASGTVDLQGKDWLQGVPPPFQVKANGKNLPLARNPDCIIRGDIDVMISKGPLAPPLIVGSVRLHDSFYLQDLKELIPGRVASPSSRPPYFSIETQPLSDWRLNLSLKGDRFIKVNSPLFRGVISADLKLTGTLKEPIALGSAKIDSGMVQFPFANLEVTQGFVTLSSENPYRPQLRVGASSRRASYDVKMEVSGPADQPVVQFSSTPPLSSEQIVLMLTAGELPRTEYTLSAYQRAQSVAMYLGKNLLSKFGVSQDSDRLSIQSGENITETGSLTYRVEYKLTNRWYLVGEYDRFSALNLGLKWKIYSK